MPARGRLAGRSAVEPGHELAVRRPCRLEVLGEIVQFAFDGCDPQTQGAVLGFELDGTSLELIEERAVDAAARQFSLGSAGPFKLGHFPDEIRLGYDWYVNESTGGRRSTSGQRLDLNPSFAAYVSWSGIRARIEESSRSDEGKTAGVWAIDELKSQLGDDWMERVGQHEGSAPSQLTLSPSHAVAFGELLDLSLRLHLLRDVEGMGVVRRDLKTDLREERRLHTRVVLDVAALAHQRGYHVAVEKRLAADLAPIDVVVTTPDGVLECEVFAVLIDDAMRLGMDYTERIDQELCRIRWENGVEVDGQLQAVLTDEQTAAWLAQVEEAAKQVKIGGTARVVDHPVGPVTVVPRVEAGRRKVGFTGPLVTGKGNNRLGTILRKKGKQAVGSGAAWIRADVLDGRWQFTQWAGWPLPTKGEAIAQEVREALSDIDGIAGAVLSCGPVMNQGTFVGESARLRDGGFAIRRTFAPFRVRETVVVPLRSEHDDEAAKWVELYDGEPDWLDWALATVGLSSAAAVLDHVPMTGTA